jgi:hypothetical protein
MEQNLNLFASTVVNEIYDKLTGSESPFVTNAIPSMINLNASANKLSASPRARMPLVESSLPLAANLAILGLPMTW